MERQREVSPFVLCNRAVERDVGTLVSVASDKLDSAASPADADLLVRVGQALSSIASARALTDTEILQHASDCTRLMEEAYQRFEETQDPADRHEAVRWMLRRDQARQSLSPQWKAQREEGIQKRLTGDYFVDQGDAARAQIVGGRS